MNILILVAIIVVLLYFALATARSYQDNREAPDNLDEDMLPWTCPECGFYVQMGTSCIYCQEKKPSA